MDIRIHPNFKEDPAEKAILACFNIAASSTHKDAHIMRTLILSFYEGVDKNVEPIQTVTGPEMASMSVESIENAIMLLKLNKQGFRPDQLIQNGTETVISFMRHLVIKVEEPQQEQEGAAA